MGNWSNLINKSGGSTDLNQSRAHNKVNEIDDDEDHADGPAGITTTTGANWADPEHDAAGNMTTMPQPKNLSSSYTAKYDAWNRLVAVFDPAVSTTVPLLANEYDGNHHRIQKVVGADTFDYYYNHRWQVLQESKNGSLHATNAWHPFYIDALAVRRNAAGNRDYFTHDANYNVTAAVDVDATSGTFKQVVERYAYTPYGEVTFLDADFSVDADQESDIGNNYLYTGRERDPVTALYDYRTRFYHAPLGRFTSRDWIEYGGGMNLYAYVGGMPTGFVDPFGFKLVFGDPTESQSTAIIFCGSAPCVPSYMQSMIDVLQDQGIAVIFYTDAGEFINDNIPDNAIGFIVGGHGSADLIAGLSPSVVSSKIREFKERPKFCIFRGCHSKDFLNSVNEELNKKGRLGLSHTTFTISNYGYITGVNFGQDAEYLKQLLSGKLTVKDDIINHNFFWDMLGELLFKENKKCPKVEDKLDN